MTEPALLTPVRAHAPADVIFTFDWISWDGAQRRGMNFPGDRLVLTLLRSPLVGRVLVADNVRSRPVRALRRMVGDDGPARFPADATHRHVRPLRWRRDDPVSLAATRRWVAGYERTLREEARRMGMERPALVISHPLIAGFGDFAWAGSVTYFAIDDWAAHPGKRRWWPLIEAAHEALRATGRRTCAVSTAILDRVAPTGPALVVPNGITPAEWSEPGPAPAWLRDAPGPRMLYTGTLDGRLDRTWLRAVSEAFPAASIHLVGPLADPEHIAPLTDLPNLSVHPSLDRAGIVAVVSGADVGLLPHVRTPLTDAMSPLKLYEYLGAGLPVAATDLQPVRDVSPRVVLAPPGGDFVAAVGAAIALGRAGERERLAFLEDNSWARRHDAVLEFVLAPDERA